MNVGRKEDYIICKTCYLDKKRQVLRNEIFGSNSGRYPPDSLQYKKGERDKHITLVRLVTTP